MVSFINAVILVLAVTQLLTTAVAAPGWRGPVSNETALNLHALTNGELGDMPAQMLVLRAIMVQQNATASSTVPVSEKAPARPDKSATDKNNGAVVGNVIGGALAAGGMSAITGKGTVASLCKAMAIGAGSAVGMTVGQGFGMVYPDPPTNDTAGSFNGNEPSDTEKGLVPAMMGNFGGTAVSGALAEQICERFIEPNIKNFLDKHPFGKKLWAKNLPMLLRKVLTSLRVPEGNAAQFVSSLQSTLHWARQLEPQAAMEALQMQLSQGTAELAQAFASGESLASGASAGMQSAVSSILQLEGVVNSVVAGSGAAMSPSVFSSASPLQNVNSLLGQLSDISNQVPGFSGPPSEVSRQLSAVRENLRTSVDEAIKMTEQGSRAGKMGSKAMKEVSDAAGKALHGLGNMFKIFDHDSSSKKTKHVAKTVVRTKTEIENETHHKTLTDYVTQTDRVTRTVHVTSTEIHRKTSTYVEQATETHYVVETKTATTTKTQTVQETIRAAPIFGPAAPILEPKIGFRCDMDLGSKKLKCSGPFDRLGVKYHEVRDHKFEKCVKNNNNGLVDGRCFNKGNKPGSQARYFSDTPGKMRGVACSMDITVDLFMECWGTPKKSPVQYNRG